MSKDIEEMKEALKEQVLEIRQYLCNTEFAPEPFTEPIDPDVLLNKFPDQLLSLKVGSLRLAIVDDEFPMPSAMECGVPHHYIRRLLKAGYVKEVSV